MSTFERDTDDTIGLTDALPWEVKKELHRTNTVFQITNTDVDKSEASKGFKEQWRSLYNEWTEYYKKHTGFIGSIHWVRDEVYRRAIDYRKQADTYRSALMRFGAKVTPAEVVDKSTETMGPPKSDGSGITLGKVAAVAGGLVAFKWLWNKAGKSDDKVEIHAVDDEDE